MNRSGITIIEVLISIAIIGIIVAAFASLQITNLRATRDSKLASSATEVATQAMETLARQVATQFPDYKLCPGASTVSCSGALTGISAGYTANYSMSYNSAGLVQIDVSVTGPSTAQYSQYVSCLDFNSPAPTMKTPAPCPTS